jgi:5'-nucleotidase
VIAPATNQSGSGDNKTTSGTIPVAASMTASGHAATAVTGFPADSVLFGLKQQLSATPPDPIVSGINLGQNYTGDIIPISGTVGAAFWAARLGFPAFAVSASGASPEFAAAATYTATLVEKFRLSKGFRKKMLAKDAPFQGLVLNVNYPTCTTGTAVRGARVVAVGRLTTVTGYTDMGSGNWHPVTASGNFNAADCTSTLDPPSTDLEAWNNGFVAVSPLDADRSVAGRKLRDFRFVEKLF